jgi:ligand-binding SRPBCC domain-containing protein
MKIQKQSGIYRLHTTQKINAPLEDVWHFFSNPQNLQLITPQSMTFEITSEDKRTIQEGDIITYKVGIFPLIKTNWVTEIKNVKELRSFVDEQRFGPYRMWHHQHKFEETTDGTIVTDEVHFKVSPTLFSSLAFNLFIRKNLKAIFNYRAATIHVFFEKVNYQSI